MGRWQIDDRQIQPLFAERRRLRDRLVVVVVAGIVIPTVGAQTHMVPNLPHAQHIHGNPEGRDFVCPGPAANVAEDANGDGLMSAVEGSAAYGSIFIALTTEGSTGSGSGLALDRFPVADQTGQVLYDRTLSAEQVPEGTIAHIADLTVVEHGIDIDGNGEYDLDTDIRESQLAQVMDASGVPAEATYPAACGAALGATLDVDDGS